MATRSSRTSAGALEELESLGDRLSDWVSDHPWPVVLVIAGALLVAAAIGGYVTWSRHEADHASAAFASLHGQYVVAMGGSPGDLEAPEPANPVAARTTRATFAKRFLALAKKESGTTAAVLANLEAGKLLAKNGEPKQALAAWQAALDGTGRGTPLRGLVLLRLARAQAGAGQNAQAAKSDEEAAGIEGFPLRWLALAQAVQDRQAAGQTDQARALAERFRTEAPKHMRLPSDLQQTLEQLTAGPTSEAGSSGSDTPSRNAR